MTRNSSLSEKLRALGVKSASTIETEKKTKDMENPIHSVVEGRYIQSKNGEIFVSELVFESGHHYGRASIKINTPLPNITAWTKEPRFSLIPLGEYAFLDTETSGLAGGTGTFIFLVGIARFINNHLHLSQFFMRDPSEEFVFLEEVGNFLAPCTALVTFNGKAFDAPLLATRYIMHHIPPPINEFAHLDLLPLARRLWRDRLPSRALKYLEEHILHAPRTTEEVPGYEIPYLYADYLRSGDATQLKGVFYHNAMDVIALAALLSHIVSILENPFSPLVEHGLDFIALGKYFEDIDEWDTAARLYERGLEMDLPEEDFWQAVRRLSQLQKRRGNLESALGLWERAASQGHIYAHIEIAKYYEHHTRDYIAARNWTESAIKQTKEQNLPDYVQSYWMDDLCHRLIRLQRKTGE